MQPEIILKSDVLDILFENRNKEYGAYTLRREYDARLSKAMLITFSLAALLLLLLFSFKTKNKNIHPAIISDYFITKTILPLQPKKKPEVPKKHGNILSKKTTQTIMASTIFTKPVVMQDDAVTKSIPKNDEVLRKNISTVTTGGLINTNQQNVSIGDGDGNKNGNQPGTGITDNSLPINNPDVYPDFPGGKEALLNFLRRNLTNPKDLEDVQSIAVRIRFIVNADGSISGFDVIESGGSDFDNEVLRVLKKMPHWIPGKSGGHDVSVYYEVPVKFVTDNN